MPILLEVYLKLGGTDMSVPELSKQALERSRTQKELSAWVNKVLSAFASTPEGKSAFRLNKGGHVKQLVEEMLPLMRFAEEFFAGNSERRFRLVIGNQS